MFVEATLRKCCLAYGKDGLSFDEWVHHHISNSPLSLLCIYCTQGDDTVYTRSPVGKKLLPNYLFDRGSYPWHGRASLADQGANQFQGSLCPRTAKPSLLYE